MRNRLMQLRDETYAQFQRKLLPTLEAGMIIGVRTPVLRAMAKEMRKGGEAEAFMQRLPHETFEENQLHAFLISECRDFDDAIWHLRAFLPYVDNWATCDQLRPKAFKKEKEKLLPYIREWMQAQHVYTIRFGMEMLMCHYMDEAFDERYLVWAAEVKNALRYVVGLMLDIHNLSLIRIENVAHSQSDFKFCRHLSEYKPNVYKNYKWSTFFTAQSNSYAVFHADLWAEDMDVCHAKNKAEFTKGELHDWVAANGAMAAELLSEINPENIMTLRRYLELDYLNYDMMARAGYRLAKLLNETIK